MGDDGEQLTTRAYVDLFSGAAQQVGDRLTRAAALALAPVDLLLWSGEQVRRWVSEDLPARLRRRGTAEGRIAPPSPQILGGVLAGLQVAGPDPVLRELYGELLATAMDPDAKAGAHPAYLEVLRQLLPDEARLFALVARHGFVNLPRRSKTWSLRRGEFLLTEIYDYTVLGDEAGCAEPAQADHYALNLERVGLIEHTQGGVRLFVKQPVPLGAGYQIGLQLTDFGEAFADATQGPRNRIPHAPPSGSQGVQG